MKQQTFYRSDVSEFSRPWAKVASFGDGVEDTPRSVTTVEWPSVSDPVDPDTLLLQGEEYHEGGYDNTTGKCGGSDTDTEAVRKAKSNRRGGNTY